MTDLCHQFHIVQSKGADTMKQLRTIPSLGVRKEQIIFVCPSCKELDTKVRRLP
jgi:hypothetical protein